MEWELAYILVGDRRDQDRRGEQIVRYLSRGSEARVWGLFGEISPLLSGFVDQIPV